MGQIVCRDDFEKQHPQEFIHGRSEKINVHDARPDPDPIVINPGDVTQDDL